jgi:positive regulator of sigma E activity
MQQTARVTRIEPGRVWIVAAANHGCHSCAQHGSCGSAALAQALPQRELAVDCDLPLTVGAQVKVEIADAHLLQASFWVYGLPLCITLLSSALFSLIPAFQDWLPEITLCLLLLSFRAINVLHKTGLVKPALQLRISAECK